MSENNNKKGFEGLSSLESKVDPVISKPKHDDKSDNTKTTADKTDNRDAPPPISVVEPKFTYSPEREFIKKYWVWIAIGIFLIYVVSSGDDKPTSKSKSSTYSQSSALIEKLPKYGSGEAHVLTASELYYCLAEEVRINQNRESINQYSDNSIDRFNKTISDFNGRCGDFRYKQSAMTAAKNALEINRYIIEAQGQARM